MENDDIPFFSPASRNEWREWLYKNHHTKAVWLVYYKKASGRPSITYDEAVEEALCFGWIDSKRVSLDEERFKQFFSRRKPKSVWSKVNKQKIAQLTEAGLMTPAGNECIRLAKENGSWTSLDQVEDLIVPADLQAALDALPAAASYFHNLSRSARKMLLQWVYAAKRPETREHRVKSVASNAAQSKKPDQFS